MHKVEEIKAAAQYVQSKTSVTPEIGIILGSGLGPMADEIQDAVHMLGRLEFNNEGIYWNPIFGVTADNINELVGNGN